MRPRPLPPSLLALTVALTAALAAAACAGPDADRAARTPADSSARSAASTEQTREALPRDAAVALDRANADFRAGRDSAALAGYRTAAVRAPTHAAPWYGVFMVARKTRNTALADSAMAAIRARTVEASSLTDEAMAAAHGDVPLGAHAPIAPGTRAPLPAGHPPIAPKSLPPGHPSVQGKSSTTVPPKSGG